MLTAEICVNLTAKNIFQVYTYAVPEKFKFLAQGWRVIVPFGKQIVDGFIMCIKDTDEKFDFELKEILDVVDDEIWFTPTMFEMADWISDFYLCPQSQAMSLFMAGNHSKKIAPKFENIIKPVENFSDIKLTKTQETFLQQLRERGEIPLSEIKSRSIIKTLLEKNLIVKEQRRILRDSYSNIDAVQKDIRLTDEQINAVETAEIYLKLKMHVKFLLHGVTGSGKTQVYIELTKIVRKLGRRALILVPEISLTGQIVKNFKAHFPDIMVIHSKLSIAERNDIFYKIRRGEVGIVIGARSAIFTPLDDVGLIVIDEEQDSSYKQDTPPFYHAKIIAEQFAKIQNAAIIFGSATPSFETFYRTQKGEIIYLELSRRISNNPLPQVECVDMCAELKAGNKSVLSSALKNLLQETLESHQQAILLLNRRGYSTFVMCRDCGAVVTCPECGLPMHYHITDKTLKCHYCEVEMTPPPTVCPKCHSKRIKYFGTGTQKLEEFLSAELPTAKIVRMDRDTTIKKFAYDKILESFKRGEFDILFGTKMVAKGHDVPNVTAVGILSADSVLNFPDFRAAEQCFELITQAAGRAGRGDLSGKVIVQTYNVDADAVKFACQQDFKSFYNSEISKRELLFYPPYSRLIKLIFASKNKFKAKDFAERVVNSFKLEVIKDSDIRQEILGPIPADIENLRGEFRFAVLIKTEALEIVRGFLRFHNLHISPEVQIDIDPIKTS